MTLSLISMILHVYVRTHMYMVHVGDGKSGKGDQQQRQGKAGSGWGFNLIKYILPKKKNEAHLPRDDKPSVSCHHLFVCVVDRRIMFC